MPTFIQPSFAKGVIGSQLYGRVDTAAYQVALRGGTNMNIHPYGGASNRPGSLFVGPVKDHSYAPALIPFQFKTTDSYMLEFGDMYMRVIRNDAHVTETPKTIVGITKANPAVVNVTAHGYVTGEEVYLLAAGMTQVNQKRYKITVTDADHFSLQDQVTGANINSTSYGTFTSGTAARIYTVVTPYVIADVARLKWTQSGDIMTIVMKNYPPYELRRLDHASWTFTPLVTSPGVDFPTNETVTRLNGAGAVTYQYQVTAIADDGNESLPGTATTAITVQFITAANPVVIRANAHGLSNGDTIRWPTATYGYLELNGRDFVIANKTTDTFELQGIDGTGFTFVFPATAYTNNGGTGDRTGLNPITVTQAGFTKTGADNNLVDGGFGLNTTDSWSITSTSFADGNYILFDFGTKKYITEITLKNDRALTNTWGDWICQTSDDGASFNTLNTFTWNTQTQVQTVTGANAAGNRYFRLLKSGAKASATATFFEEVEFKLAGPGDTDAVIHANFVRLTTGNATASNRVDWTAVTGVSRYNIYKLDNGVYGYIGASMAATFTDDNIAADLSVTPPQQQNPFDTANDYPDAIGNYEQRNVLGGSNNGPDTSEYSQTGRPRNFNVSSPLQADDAITATLASGEINEIRHYVALNDLITLTSGEEYKVSSGPDSAFSATTIRQKKQSAWGVSHLRPIVIGATILMVEANLARVRSLGYSYQLDGYDGSNMSVLAPQFFEHYGITRWAYALHPESRVHAVREDGKALALTFDKEQEVVAWTDWRTDGKYENVGTLRNPETNASRESGIYFVVKRQINGSTVRYIEKQESREFLDPRDARFLDCGLTYDSPIAITAITHASPMVIIAAGHGLINGDVVNLSDIEWTSTYDAYMNETVGDFLPTTTSYKVASKTTDTFQLTTLADVAISSLAFTAYVSGGYVRKMVTTVTGFDHLEGRTDVAALADGVPVFNLTVTNGAITLSNAAGRVNAGLRYVSDMETLNVEAPSGNTIQGALIRIPEVCVRVKDTRGIMIGGIGDSADDLPDFTLTTSRELDYNMDTAELFTGDIHVPIDTGNNSNGRIIVRQIYPQPMTVLAVIPKVI